MKLKLRGDRNQCPTCSEYFNSTFAFDKHRTGRIGIDRRCMTPTEMLEHGMSKNEAGFWVSKRLQEADLEARKSRSEEG
jgi:hypothetical protein